MSANGTRALRVRDWVGLAIALFVLNAGFTMHNVWPTIWVTLRGELSIDFAVLLLALVAWSSFVRPLGRIGWGVVTLIVLACVIGRYAEVTAPGLYGRPVNLYWDAEHLPKVAAMLVEVTPWWALVAGALGATALVAALLAATLWCLRRVARALRVPWPRRMLGALAVSVVGFYALAHLNHWPGRFRYSVPVSSTYWQQAQFFLAARAAAENRRLPITPLTASDLRGAAGDDVLLVFLESYGAASYDTPSIARTISPARDELAHAAEETGRQVLSGFFTAPTFGGGSWLSHASFMSEVEVRDPGDYMLLLTQTRDTWPKAFKAAGYRAIAVMPGTKSEWPEGSFYGFDALYGERDVDYRGPDFGWWRIPDQFSLARVAALGASEGTRAPLFAFLATINTHIPFLPVPPYQIDWARLVGDDPFDAAAVEASLARTPDWEALGEPYAESFAYTFTYLAGYLRQRRSSDELIVLIGDHQPAASVAGPGARWEVPVHVVTRRPELAAALLAQGFIEGVALAPGQRSLGTLAELSALLLTTLDSGAGSGAVANGVDVAR